MSEARRGEIWWVDLGEPVGREQGFERPALVVSSDQWNRHASTLTVLPLTKARHEFPTRVEIEPDADNGLDLTSYARVEDVRSISERRLVRRAGSVGAEVMSAVARTLRLFFEV